MQFISRYEPISVQIYQHFELFFKTYYSHLHQTSCICKFPCDKGLICMVFWNELRVWLCFWKFFGNCCVKFAKIKRPSQHTVRFCFQRREKKYSRDWSEFSSLRLNNQEHYRNSKWIHSCFNLFYFPYTFFFPAPTRRLLIVREFFCHPHVWPREFFWLTSNWPNLGAAF